MAIELRKYNPDPALNSANWGFDVSDKSYWRVLGQDIYNNPQLIYEDVLRTGAIRGSENYSRDAYFAYGSPEGNYLSQARLSPNSNYIIEATKNFDPNVNPLYKNNIYNPATKQISVNGVTLPSPRDSMVIGSRWQTEKALGKEPHLGTYSTIVPEENTSFWQRINPNNQKNLRMGQFFSGETEGKAFINPMKGFQGGPPKTNWLFDYTKPFTKTSIPQHIKNAWHIAETVAAQPEVAKVASVAGKGLVVAGAGLEVANVPRRMQGYYMNALKNDPNWRPDPSDKIGMAFMAGIESAANFATLGFYDQKERIATDMTSGAGYGKGYYGTMAPPAGTTSVHYNPESRYQRTGVSFNHLYPKAP